MALDIARNLNFDMEIMSELLPIGLAGMNTGLKNEYSSEKIINQA